MSLTRELIQFQDIWKPRHPFAADSYTEGVYKQSRSEAIKRRHIQGNTPAQINLITLDIDSPNGVMDVLENNEHLQPHWVSEGANGHVHATWALLAPVTVSAAGREKPRLYLEATSEGLRRRFNGDAAYTSFLFKNPESPAWTHYHSRTQPLRTLGGISSALEYEGYMPLPEWKRQARKDKHVPGISRNCDLFEELASIARSNARHYASCPDGADKFSSFVYNTAHELNASMPFAAPLGAVEVNGIARSVSRWIITKSRIWQGVHEPKWIEKQKALSARGNAVKSAQSSERIMLARYAYMQSGGMFTNKQIAEAVGMSVEWVRKNRAAIKGTSTHC